MGLNICTNKRCWKWLWKMSNKKLNFNPTKVRGLSVQVVELFDEESKTKRLVYVYSPYEELKTYSLKFENKGKSVYKYMVKMITKNDKLYPEKKLFR